LNWNPVFLSVFPEETLINPNNSKRITTSYVHSGSNVLLKPEGKTVTKAPVTDGLQEGGGCGWLSGGSGVEFEAKVRADFREFS
jgi:hypothetical protein